jgi:hypothetical protein
MPSTSETPSSSASILKFDLYVYEMAARILFYIVHWLRSLKQFQEISIKDQVRLPLLIALDRFDFIRLDRQSSALLARNLSSIVVRIQVRRALDQSHSSQ